MEGASGSHNRSYRPAEGEEGENTNKAHMYHAIHKVPCGDGPYVRAKHAQVNQSPSSISLIRLGFTLI